MKVVIIEDESRAANRIIRLLSDLAPEAVVVAQPESIEESLNFLRNNKVDLIISDIQLADGLSFEIYKNYTPECPIIFTTAYDQYAIKAFETNGIDYLLKPIEKERLQQALNKLEKLKPNIDLSTLIALASNKEQKAYKSRFMIKVGEKIKSIPVEEVALFYSMDKGTFLHTRENRNYVLDQSLEQVEDLVDPKDFFRISRKYIIALQAPMDIIAHTNSRLKLKVKGFDDENVVVARERVKEFKGWLDR